MTRALSAPTAAAAANTFTQPGYLIQLDFSTSKRFSSRGDVTWNGFNWLNNNVRVGALQELPSGGVALSVAIGNTDLAFGALCLLEPPQEKAISVWAFYEGAVGIADPLLIFSGVIDGCDISEGSVQLQLSDLNSNTLFIPRERISRTTGFNRLIPAGRIIEFGGVRYELTKG